MSLQWIIGLILSAAIGLSLGLIGGGGSIITVPVLVYVLGVEPHQAISMSLAVVGTTSLIASASHRRRGAVDLRTGALFGASGIGGAYLGSHLTYLFSPQALLLAFGLLMMAVAVILLVRSGSGEETAPQKTRGPLKAAAAGFLVGGMTGFLGVGGGFLIVPALVFFGGLAMKDAIGTSLLVIAINCAAGLLGHIGHGNFDLRLTLLVTSLAAGGAVAGTALSHRASPAALRRWFAVFVIAVALFLIAKNFRVLLP